ILERRLGAPALAFRGYASAAEVAAAVADDPAAIGFLGATQPGALAHAVRLVPIRNREHDVVYPTRDALESESYPLGVTIWLLSDPASRDDLRTLLRSWSDAIPASAGAAD